MEYEEMNKDQKLAFRLWADLEGALVQATEVGIWDPELCDVIDGWVNELSRVGLISTHDFEQAVRNVEDNRALE